MNYATVQRDGFKVPLIGIAEEETQEHCVHCERPVDLMQTRLINDRPHCDKCARQMEEMVP
jgi:hypothetical protein